MSRVVLPLAGIGVALGILFQPAVAQQEPDVAALRACDRHTDLVDRLAGQYKEAPAGFGIQLNGNLLQLYVSKETGTWTLLTTTPDGLSCIVGAGESWENLPEPNTDPYA
ncbi:MAG TPA: hypothetical protein VFG47_06370 [Geminicoccaceae bacterium]|nr:hypothetical protein [Geminicoccaceae bacterium]